MVYFLNVFKQPTKFILFFVAFILLKKNAFKIYFHIQFYKSYIYIFSCKKDDEKMIDT